MTLSMRNILATLDSIECDIHSSYKRLYSLRRQLRQQWDVPNPPGYWGDEQSAFDAVGQRLNQAVGPRAPESDVLPASTVRESRG